MEDKEKIRITWHKFWPALLLALVLFIFAYVLQAGLESAFLIDYRYKFPYASDLTLYRLLMFVIYLPLFLIGFL